MSKGKTPAKGAAPAVVENPDGAKFATVRLGTTDHPISMLINLNCPVDIILDNVKRLMAKRIDAVVQEINEGPKPDPPPPAEEGAEPAVVPPVDDPAAVLLDIKGKLLNAECSLDLSDQSGAAVNCREV